MATDAASAKGTVPALPAQPAGQSKRPRLRRRTNGTASVYPWPAAGVSHLQPGAQVLVKPPVNGQRSAAQLRARVIAERRETEVELIRAGAVLKRWHREMEAEVVSNSRWWFRAEATARSVVCALLRSLRVQGEEDMIEMSATAPSEYVIERKVKNTEAWEEVFRGGHWREALAAWLPLQPQKDLTFRFYRIATDKTRATLDIK